MDLADYVDRCALRATGPRYARRSASSVFLPRALFPLLDVRPSVETLTKSVTFAIRCMSPTPFPSMRITPLQHAAPSIDPMLGSVCSWAYCSQSFFGE